MKESVQAAMRWSAVACALAASDGASAAAQSSEASITVTGGPHAGTHTLKVADIGCEVSKSKGQPKYFNDNFGVDNMKDPKRLSFVLVRIRNADGPGSPRPPTTRRRSSSARWETAAPTTCRARTI
jgi:hypothetical protein